MERRTLLSKEELQKVIELREIGSSWVKIQRETGVNRKTAKNAYEDWERRQSKEKLQQARVQVGTVIFREHLECIVKVAETLIDNLPQSMVFFETRDAETVFRQIWMRDIVGQLLVHAGGSWDRVVSIVPFERLPERQKQRILRQNLKLFESVREHTRGEVRWEALGEWRRGWDECLGIFTELRSKAETMVRQKVENMEKRNQVEKSIANMAKGVVEALWLGTLDGKPEKSYDLIRAKVDRVEFGGETQVLVEDEKIARKVAAVCKGVIKNLCEEKSLAELLKNGNQIKTAVEQLEQELDPFVLRRIILKTECSLCPA